jgi:serine protease
LIACKREPLTPEEMPVQGEVLRMKPVQEEAPSGPPIPRDVLDERIIRLLEERNEFRWEWVDVATLWSAALYNDNSVSIGYKPHRFQAIDAMLHSIDISSNEWRAVHDALIEKILEMLNSDGIRMVTLADILVEDDPVLPVITLRLTDPEVLTFLRNLENVRYVEPLDYWPERGQQDDRSTTGCSSSTLSLNSADVSSISPNARQPWNFNNHSIPMAWNSAQGQGITIGVIDAGLSSAQSLLGADFNNGDSNVGRTITTGFTFGTSAFTSCTHGTSMTALAAGPRNANGATTGAAYRSNVHFIRACEDVVLDKSSERTAVKNALVAMGNSNAIRIISMSIGTPFSFSVLSDGVNYAHGKGKLLFGAAGTSYSWTSWYGVIYPAAYANCIAVTGVKENGSRCSSCHDGSQVRYTIIMERDANSARNSLALPASGTAPTYIGGSSAATATVAGIAAMVWSAAPSRTREQIVNCLSSTAQFFPTLNSTKGHGNVNAAAAVACALSQ